MRCCICGGQLDAIDAVSVAGGKAHWDCARKKKK